MKIIKFITVFILSFICALGVGILLGSLISGESFAATSDKFFSLKIVESIGVPLLAIFAFVLAVVVNVIVHEAGHLVFGMASGYRFLSFSIFNYTFVKEAERVKVKKYSLSGTLGQCLMLPPDVPPERIPVVAYNIGGVIFNLLICIIFGAALFLCHGHPVAAVFCAMFVLAGLFLIIVNGIPMVVSGIPNDGMNALRLSRNSASRKAFANMLKANALVQNGVRPRDLDDTLLLRPDEVDFAEPMQVNNLMAYASRLMDCGDLDESLAVNQMIIEKAGKVKVLNFEAKCEVASILLMQGNVDKAKGMLNTQEMMQVKANAKSMTSKQRLLCLLALKADGDAAKAREIYDQCVENRNNYTMLGELEMDLALMSECLNASKA